MVSKASEDFPEPDSPVNTTSLSRGISRSTFLRLCSRAPRIVIARWEVAWRFALSISSISAFPRRPSAASVQARIAGDPGSGRQWGEARNVGRTSDDFQCPLRIINGLFRAEFPWRQVALLRQTKRPARGRPLQSDCSSVAKSVVRDRAVAPAIVDSNRDEIDIPADVVDA